MQNDANAKLCESTPVNSHCQHACLSTLVSCIHIHDLLLDKAGPSGDMPAFSVYMQGAVLIGHSTGCQDAVRYVARHKDNQHAAAVIGVVLQAPVRTTCSTRYFFGPSSER